MEIPIHWRFERKGIFPIIEARGESSANGSEIIMLQQAVRFMEKAIEFQGRMLLDEPQNMPNNKSVVMFSVIFPSENSISGFMNFLEQNR